MLVFAENGLMQSPDFLLQRALLQYGDYLTQYGGKRRTFGDRTCRLDRPAPRVLAGCTVTKSPGQIQPDLAQAREDLLAIIARPPDQ